MNLSREIPRINYSKIAGVETRKEVHLKKSSDNCNWLLKGR